MSSSSGTPSDDAYRSPALDGPSGQSGGYGYASAKQDTQGWTNSSYNRHNSPPYGSSHSAGPSGTSYAQPPLTKPQPEYAWTAPPSQTTNYHQNNYNGRPLSPDGWPAKKQEIRGHEQAVPDLLSQYVNNQSGSSTNAQSSGWKTTSSNVSGNTVTAAKETPLPPSEAGGTAGSSSRPSRSTPALPPLSVPTAIPAVPEQRAPRPQIDSPAPVIPIAPISVAPAAVNPSPTSQAQLQQQQSALSEPRVQESMPGTTRPQSQSGTRIINGWTAKDTVKSDDDVPPVPSMPQGYPQPQSSAAYEPAAPLVQSVPETTLTSQEAWILPNADAIKNNNWTSTTRRSRVSKEEQMPAYTHSPLYGREEASSSTLNTSWYDDNSIRPSESASNVGIADDSMASPTGSQSRGRSEVGAQSGGQNAFGRRPMPKFESEKDSDLGSDDSSGSLNDNPNVRAGGWQRSPAVLPPQESRMARQLSGESNARAQQRTSAGHPGHQSQHSHHGQESRNSNRDNGWSMPQAHTSGWIQTSAQNDHESRPAPLTAPTPRRWDSASQQLVGDLERAATPRAPYSAHFGPGHGRSVSTATRAPGSTMSIRGASKYHAETVMLREEVSLYLRSYLRGS